MTQLTHQILDVNKIAKPHSANKSIERRFTKRKPGSVIGWERGDGGGRGDREERGEKEEKNFHGG